MFHRDFTAALFCTTPSFEGQVGITAAPSGSLFTGVEDGWLAIEGVHDHNRVAPVRFRFIYREHGSDRVHYDVSCATAFRGFKGSWLNTSRNSYLGMYGTRPDGPYWKIEVVGEWDGTLEGAEGLDIRLRDQDGYVVKRYQEPMVGQEHLNVSSGEDLTFCLKGIAFT